MSLPIPSAVLEQHIGILGKSHLSQLVGLSGGNFTNLLGSLRTRGAIEYPSPGVVRISPQVMSLSNHETTLLR
jgi:hypothetical protein